MNDFDIPPPATPSKGTPPLKPPSPKKSPIIEFVKSFFVAQKTASGEKPPKSQLTLLGEIVAHPILSLNKIGRLVGDFFAQRKGEEVELSDVDSDQLSRTREEEGETKGPVTKGVPRKPTQRELRYERETAKEEFSTMPSVEHGKEQLIQQAKDAIAKAKEVPEGRGRAGAFLKPGEKPPSVDKPEASGYTTIPEKLTQRTGSTEYSGLPADKQEELEKAPVVDDETIQKEGYTGLPEEVARKERGELIIKMQDRVVLLHREIQSLKSGAQSREIKAEIQRKEGQIKVLEQQVASLIAKLGKEES